MRVKIENFEDYEIDTEGIVYSLKGKKERRLKQQNRHGGYLSVSLYSKINYCKSFDIHQLMAIAFLGHVPCEHDLIVDHINTIKTDNRLCNLQVITSRENLSKDKTDVGVDYIKQTGKWTARININHKLYHLGTHCTRVDALQKYKDAVHYYNNTGLVLGRA